MEQELKTKWYLIDAKGETIGRLSTRVAAILQGKNDPAIAAKRNLNPQHKVVVINTDGLSVQDKKGQQKVYTNYSGYPGGLRERKLADVLKKNSAEVIEMSVKGMLPKNRRGNAIAANLYVFTGSEHPHANHEFEKIN